jgi:hypothetical protein
MMKPENWASVSDKMWIKVGGLLGYKFSGGWVTVETTNLKLMKKVFEMAQNFGEMKCIIQQEAVKPKQLIGINRRIKMVL